MDFKDIINLWSTPSELARDLTNEMDKTVSSYVVANWKMRNKIPPDYWKFLILISNRHGYAITPGLLITLAAKQHE